MEANELKDSDTGVWQVKTEASSYIVDLDERQFLRNPGNGLGVDPSIKGRIVLVNKLQGDSQWLGLDSIGLCEVGSVMVLNISGGLPYPWIRSTYVRSIFKVYPND